MGTDEFIGKRLSLQGIINKLIRSAFFDSCLNGCPPYAKLKAAIRDNKPISEDCKPGYLVKHLPQDERDILKTCTEKDFNHRIY
jgi:hypothetical protein